MFTRLRWRPPIRVEDALQGLEDLKKSIGEYLLSLERPDALEDDYRADAWTPVLSFSTPGDLSVTYATQVGSYTKNGNEIRATFNIVTSAFTHTTASGNLQVTTLPFTPANTTGLRHYGTVQLSGITKAGYTQACPYAEVNDTTLRFQAWGSGSAVSNIVATDMPTGGTIWLRGCVIYNI